MALPYTRHVTVHFPLCRQMHSTAMQMAEAVRSYRACEAALRALPPCHMATSLLSAVLSNIANNLMKNQNLEQAKELYAEAHALREKHPSTRDDSNLAIRSGQALMLSRQGKDAEACAELRELWRSTAWEPDMIAQRKQVLLLLCNLSQPADQPEPLAEFWALQGSGSAEPPPEQPPESRTCCVCLEPLAPSSDPGSRVYITTCHHVLHDACWSAHRAAVPPEQPVGCPECRHPIIVSTQPTLVHPDTGEAIPLRPGREADDLTAALGPGRREPGAAGVVYMPGRGGRTLTSPTASTFAGEGQGGGEIAN
jgi:hypothetical protein